MQTSILDISDGSFSNMDMLDRTLSFNSFISYLQKRIAEETTMKKGFFEFVLNKFLSNKNLKDGISLEEMPQYKEELELIYALLVPAITDEQQTLWALCTPLSPSIFYGTDALYQFLTDDNKCIKCSFTNSMSDELMIKNKIQHIYSFIFEKFYKLPSFHAKEMVYSIVDEETKLTRYFNVNVDTRFIEVTAKQPLPKVDVAALVKKLESTDTDWRITMEQLPLSMFSFKGFSIITITDITAQQAVENIKSLILNKHNYNSNEYHGHVVQSLKTLSENAELEFGMLPVTRINNKLVITEESSHESVMLDAIVNKGNTNEFLNLTETFINNPRVVLYDINIATNKDNVYMQYLEDAGVASYALLPIYYNTHIAGILEVYTKTKGLLTVERLSKLEPAIPLLAQLMQNAVDEFDARVEAVIKEKFTSLQPSVQWKFNEVAWQYISNNKLPTKKKSIEPIVFKNVYPLYGAIDIRNSTIERNNALAADLQVQFNLLLQTLTAIKQQVNIALADELIYKCGKWLKAINESFIDDDHLRMNDFLEQDITPFLNHFKEDRTGLRPIIDNYFNAIDEQHGEAFHNRRILENSMQLINTSINQYLEMFRDEMQASYPCYFEKFRTDGVEYDIYMGQSLVPDKPFNQLYLKNIRLWQLTSMAAIAKITHSLLPQMEKQLLTTQLIFVRSATIDIGFRNDERKFDVEGTYNIRYQVIKKRIDKVHIKDSGERLTQPEKIALVYFNKREAEEYTEYISYLQEQGVLNNDLEHLELEELQGVNGLKALRVGVAL